MKDNWDLYECKRNDNLVIAPVQPEEILRERQHDVAILNNMPIESCGHPLLSLVLRVEVACTSYIQGENTRVNARAFLPGVSLQRRIGRAQCSAVSKDDRDGLSNESLFSPSSTFLLCETRRGQPLLFQSLSQSLSHSVS